MSKQVTALRHIFLPSRFSETGEYSEAVYARGSAFRMLVHSEFEHYVEDIAASAMQDALDRWNEQGVPQRSLQSLMTLMGPTKDFPTAVQDAEDIHKKRLSKAIGEYKSAIKSNNGVKEADLLRILLPLGLTVADFDTVWLADIDTWGTERGDVAHKTLLSIKNRVDPKRSYSKAREIVNGFRELDLRIQAL